jgi:hypothetical protein
MLLKLLVLHLSGDDAIKNKDKKKRKLRISRHFTGYVQIVQIT